MAEAGVEPPPTHTALADLGSTHLTHYPRTARLLPSSGLRARQPEDTVSEASELPQQPAPAPSQASPPQPSICTRPPEGYDGEGGGCRAWRGCVPLTCSVLALSTCLAAPDRGGGVLLSPDCLPNSPGALSR